VFSCCLRMAFPWHFLCGSLATCWSTARHHLFMAFNRTTPKYHSIFLYIYTISKGIHVSPGLINKSVCCSSKQSTCIRLETPLQAGVSILLPTVFSRLVEYLIVSLQAVPFLYGMDVHPPNHHSVF